MNDLLRTADVAKAYCIPEATLRYWRHIGIGPRSFRLGPRRVVYKRADVDAWLEAQYKESA